MGTRWLRALGCGAVAVAMVLGGRLAAADAPAPEAPNTVAFLGVGVQPASSQESRDLGLPEGVGLVVRHVEENSPAQNRINVGDVLQKLDDQLLIHPYQLAVLVRTYKPGTEVRVALRRGGNAMDVAIVLGEHAAGPLPPAGWGMPGTFTLAPAPGGAVPTNPFGVTVPVTVQALGADGAAAGAGAGTSTTVVISQSGTQNRRTATTVENGTSYSLTSVNEVATYTVTGPDGRVLFSGPVATDAERAKVPEPYRARLASLLPRIEGQPAAPPAVPAAPVPAAP